MAVDSTLSPKVSRCPPFRRQREGRAGKYRVFADGSGQLGAGVEDKSRPSWERRREEQSADCSPPPSQRDLHCLDQFALLVSVKVAFFEGTGIWWQRLIGMPDPNRAARSEEHTSELQSLTNLVC